MDNHHNQSLISEAVAYFSELYGREITADEAESLLDSLVSLYNSFSF